MYTINPEVHKFIGRVLYNNGLVEQGLFFLGKTDEEISLVCETQYKPSNCTAEEDGWRGFRIKGELDFSLIGILSKISTILAEAKVGIFAVSTYNTDYMRFESGYCTNNLSFLLQGFFLLNRKAHFRYTDMRLILGQDYVL